MHQEQLSSVTGSSSGSEQILSADDHNIQQQGWRIMNWEEHFQSCCCLILNPPPPPQNRFTKDLDEHGIINFQIYGYPPGCHHCFVRWCTENTIEGVVEYHGIGMECNEYESAFAGIIIRRVLQKVNSGE